MTTTLVLEGVPPTTTAQQKGAFVAPGGHIRFYTKAKVKAAERTWREMLRSYRDRWPKDAITTPVAVEFRLVFPYLASTPKRIQKAGTETPLDKRPDIDNLLKALIDTMTQMQFWRDDGQIYALTASKWRGARPRTEITITANATKEGTKGNDQN